jgi:hypothetical protein
MEGRNGGTVQDRSRVEIVSLMYTPLQDGVYICTSLRRSQRRIKGMDTAPAALLRAHKLAKIAAR